MHELAIIQNILRIVLKYARENRATKIVSISLTVGEFTGIEKEWMQKYFDFASKNTIAENASLKITVLPILFRCSKCQYEFQIKMHDISKMICPECNSKTDFVLISGREYFIKEMQIT